MSGPAVAEPKGAAEHPVNGALPYPRDFTVRTGDQSGAELVQGRVDERADVLAYLEQRVANCEAILRTHEAARDAEWLNASNLRRHCLVLIDNFSAGLHVGQADVARSVALMLGASDDPEIKAESVAAVADQTGAGPDFHGTPESTGTNWEA